MLPASTVRSVAYGSGPNTTGSLQVLAYFPSGLLGNPLMVTSAHRCTQVNVLEGMNMLLCPLALTEKITSQCANYQQTIS